MQKDSKNCGISIWPPVEVEYSYIYGFFVKKIFSILLLICLIFTTRGGDRVSAASNDPCSSLGITIKEGIGSNVVIEPGTTSHTIKINAPNLENDPNDPEDVYRIVIKSNVLVGASLQLFSEETSDYSRIDSNGDLTFTVIGNGLQSDRNVGDSDVHKVWIAKGTGNPDLWGNYCYLGDYKVPLPAPTCSQKINIYQNRDINGDGTTDTDEKCYSTNNGCLDTKSPVYFELSGVTDGLGSPWSGRMNLNIGLGYSFGDIQMTDGSISLDRTFSTPGSFSVVPEDIILGMNFAGACNSAQPFTIQPQCQPTSCTETPQTEVTPGGESSFKLCDQILDDTLAGKCRDCAGADGQDGVWTAVGCIKRDPVSIAERLIQVGLGMGGGVALIMTLAGGFILSTSQGDPQKANQAKEMITNAVIGLLFVIFSVVILQFIGVTILNIPGFGDSTG